MFSRIPILALSAATALFAGSVVARPIAPTPAAPAAQQPPAKGDPAKGARLFLQCRACHTIEPGGRNGVGPNLAGVIGAKAGAKAGYPYSPALTKAQIKWNPATIDAWLKRPSAVVPGNKMAFAGMADPKARADVIAYLATLKAK
jgi:cytochrome c